MESTLTSQFKRDIYIYRQPLFYRPSSSLFSCTSTFFLLISLRNSPDHRFEFAHDSMGFLASDKMKSIKSSRFQIFLKFIILFLQCSQIDQHLSVVIRRRVIFESFIWIKLFKDFSSADTAVRSNK
jgi:hypothetical protein